jgi:hypothetical protein
MMSSSMNEKIRKLMALADSSGATPAEAANAAAMAAELALKYNIDIAEACKSEQPKPKEFTFGEYAIKTNPRDRKAGIHLAHGVAELYAVKPLISALKGRTEHHFMFVGQAHNVELASSWLKYLWNSMLRSNKEYNKSKIGRATYGSDGSFRLMFAYAVETRLHDKYAAIQQQGVSETGTALVVVNWYEQERKAVQEWIDQTLGENKRELRSRASNLDGHAANAGYKAGKQVGLDDQLAGRSSPRALN